MVVDPDYSLIHDGARTTDRAARIRSDPQKRAKRSSAPIRTTNPAPSQIQKNKKIRTNPQLPGNRGKAPIRIRVQKKIKTHPKKAKHYNADDFSNPYSKIQS